MDQDLLIIFGAAALASALLLVGFMWELRRSRRPLKVRPAKAARRIAAARPAAVVAGSPAAAKRRAPIATLRDVIDASIAMYAVRHVLGWDTTPRSERSSEPLAYLDQDAVASRIGAAPTGPVVRRPTRILVSGSPRSAAPVAAGAATPPVVPGPDRRRLLRDSVFTASAVAAVLMLAVTLWPRSFQGGVLDETGTPAPSAAAIVDVAASPSHTPSPDPTASPSADGLPSETPFEEPILTPSPTPVPTATPAATPRRAARPTPRPVVQATAAPTPKATPKPTPKPTPAAKPVASFTWGNLLLVVSFNGAVSQGESGYSWSFGDGGGSSSATPTHAYLEPGDYQVTLTVTGPGGTDSDTQTVSVP